MIDRVGANNNSFSVQLKTPIHETHEESKPQQLETKKESKEEKLNKPPTKEQVEEIVNSLNEFMVPTHTSLKFEFHEKLSEYYVKVVDDKTKEVVREIPSKKMLDMYAAMTEFIGLLVDKKI